jgi:DNA-binding Lrp family transcriptional regulator
LKQFKGIKSVEMVTGPYDVIAILERDSLHEIGDSITQHIQLVNGITRTVTCLVV